MSNNEIEGFNKKSDGKSKNGHDYSKVDDHVRRYYTKYNQYNQNKTDTSEKDTKQKEDIITAYEVNKTLRQLVNEISRNEIPRDEIPRTSRGDIPQWSVSDMFQRFLDVFRSKEGPLYAFSQKLLRDMIINHGQKFINEYKMLKKVHEELNHFTDIVHEELNHFTDIDREVKKIFNGGEASGEQLERIQNQIHQSLESIGKLLQNEQFPREDFKDLAKDMVGKLDMEKEYVEKVAETVIEGLNLTLDADHNALKASMNALSKEAKKMAADVLENSESGGLVQLQSKLRELSRRISEQQADSPNLLKRPEIRINNILYTDSEDFASSLRRLDEGLQYTDELWQKSAALEGKFKKLSEESTALEALKKGQFAQSVEELSKQPEVEALQKELLEEVSKELEAWKTKSLSENSTERDPNKTIAIFSTNGKSPDSDFGISSEEPLKNIETSEALINEVFARVLEEKSRELKAQKNELSAQVSQAVEELWEKSKRLKDELFEKSKEFKKYLENQSVNSDSPNVGDDDDDASTVVGDDDDASTVVADKATSADKALDVPPQKASFQVDWWQKPGVFDLTTENIDLNDMQEQLKGVNVGSILRRWETRGKKSWDQSLSDEETARVLKIELRHAAWVYGKAKQAGADLSPPDRQALEQELEKCKFRYAEAYAKSSGVEVKGAISWYRYDMEETWSWRMGWYKAEQQANLWTRLGQDGAKSPEGKWAMLLQDCRWFGFSRGLISEQSDKDKLAKAIEPRYEYLKTQEFFRKTSTDTKLKKWGNPLEKHEEEREGKKEVFEKFEDMDTYQREDEPKDNEKVKEQIDQRSETSQEKDLEEIQATFKNSLKVADDAQKRVILMHAGPIHISSIQMHTFSEGRYVVPEQDIYDRQKSLRQEYKPLIDAYLGALALREKLFREYDANEGSRLKGGWDVGNLIIDSVVEDSKEFKAQSKSLLNNQEALNNEFDITISPGYLSTLPALYYGVKKALSAQEEVFQGLLSAQSYAQELIERQQEAKMTSSITEEQKKKIISFEEKKGSSDLKGFLFSKGAKEAEKTKKELTGIIDRHLDAASLGEEDRKRVHQYFADQWKQELSPPSPVPRKPLDDKMTVGKVLQNALDNITNYIVKEIHLHMFPQLREDIRKARTFYFERSQELKELRIIYEKLLNEMSSG